MILSVTYFNLVLGKKTISLKMEEKNTPSHRNKDKSKSIKGSRDNSSTQEVEEKMLLKPLVNIKTKCCTAVNKL